MNSIYKHRVRKREALRSLKSKKFTLLIDDLEVLRRPRPEFPHFRDCCVHIEVILCLFHDWLLLFLSSIFRQIFYFLPKSPLLWNYTINFFSFFCSNLKYESNKTKYLIFKISNHIIFRHDFNIFYETDWNYIINVIFLFWILKKFLINHGS